jgi:hypothetical protein
MSNADKLTSLHTKLHPQMTKQISFLEIYLFVSVLHLREVLLKKKKFNIRNPVEENSISYSNYELNAYNFVSIFLFRNKKISSFWE